MNCKEFFDPSFFFPVYTDLSPSDYLSSNNNMPCDVLREEQTPENFPSIGTRREKAICFPDLPAVNVKTKDEASLTSCLLNKFPLVPIR